MQQILREYLLKNPKYCYQEELTINTLVEDIRNLNPELIEYLKAHTDIKEAFFPNVSGTVLFLQDNLIKVIRDIRITSYGSTEYLSNIGLMDEDNRSTLLSSGGDIVLNFPYKDCVLEGGMSKEEAETINAQGKKVRLKEILLNEVVASKEVKQLLSPKVLQDFKVYNKDGVRDAQTKDLTSQENLLINGNNLLALHSLKEKYAGKVKLIYIDPPYNTGNDTFKYNDKFNHSTWLTFMKNRLQVAKELLADDGVIFVQCDDNEQAYLKILMDEVFGRENFIGNINRVTTKRIKGDAQNVNIIHDYIVLYSRNSELCNIYHNFKSDYTIYSEKDEHIQIRGKYLLRPLDNPTINYSIKSDYIITLDTGEMIVAGADINARNKRLEGQNNKKDWCFRWSKEKYDWGLKNDMIIIKHDKKKNLRVYFKIYQFVDNNLEPVQKYDNFLSIIDECYNNQGTTELKKLNIKGFSYPKPEKLLKILIDATTQPNDIVLDFFAGSGTTLAVAHKMGRRWIGVEQLDEHIDICKQRLAKVISGEDQGGISKSVNWQGGGSFISCSLAKYNQIWKEQIQQVNTKEELQTLYQEMKRKSVIQYRVAKKNRYNELTNKDFLAKELDTQKIILIEVLDKNFLYIPLAHLEDELFGEKISVQNIELNKQFYNAE